MVLPLRCLSTYQRYHIDLVENYTILCNYSITSDNYTAMWINRSSLHQIVLERAAERPVVVVTGVRQVGKSSLLAKCFPQHHYVSLDLPSIAEAAERDPEQFLREHPAPLVIDEVQYAPKIFRHIKRLVDDDRSPGRFILSGSQKFVLMQEVADSLAGRAAILEIEGVRGVDAIATHASYDELDLLLRSGFPELLAKPALNAAAWLRDYTITYLERDLRSLIRVNQLRDFERFLRLAALRGGQLLNQAELARDVGVAPSTIGQWLSVLQASGMIVLLEPWFNNASKRMVKSPKLYFTEVALQTSLCGINSREELQRSPLLGALWETFVCAELRRAESERLGSSRFYFYRDQTREADFLFDRGGRITLLDAKWNELPDSSSAKGLQQVANRIGPELIDDVALICRTAQRFPLSGGVNALSWKSI
jgi:uncharacterized protein